MPELDNYELEGRLNAQREVLTLLLTRLVEGGDTELLATIEGWVDPEDHQEDPGAVPNEAFAAEGAAMLEYRLIAEQVRARSRS
ncbi:hypothetical protein [Nitratireductor basaltis]|uniref:Uncharacterized protein n=1 Tax=Nitratireductor basaltis TaxID=472175 RepID=A0A084UAZ7_9HYPH|nr:hypothetical protein [Nitratireductor basaltis]KFB10133.1 hypothetical protein EL18_01163 [Nitratireductor basaltis]